jgi:hypothetical protein
LGTIALAEDINKIGQENLDLWTNDGSNEEGAMCSCSVGWLLYQKTHSKAEFVGCSAQVYPWYAKKNPRWDHNICIPELTNDKDHDPYYWGHKKK